MSDEKDPRSDLDAPTPPGGPQRADAPSGHDTPGDEAKEPGPGVERVSKRDDSHDVPAPTHHDERDPSPAEEDVQEENAETSLDQPSS